MPAFSFEKIAPPVVRRDNVPGEPRPRPQRGVIGRMLDRFAHTNPKTTHSGGHGQPHIAQSPTK